MNTLVAVAAISLAASSSAALAAPAVPPPYGPITPTLSDKTIVLTGRNLTLEQVVDVARFGAKVALTAEARRRSADAHNLLLEAAAEGVSVCWFNRGSARCCPDRS